MISTTQIKSAYRRHDTSALLPMAYPKGPRRRMNTRLQWTLPPVDTPAATHLTHRRT